MSLLSEREYALLERLVCALESIDAHYIRVRVEIDPDSTPIGIEIVDTKPNYMPIDEK
jgi:hypothetical protein